MENMAISYFDNSLCISMKKVAELRYFNAKLPFFYLFHCFPNSALGSGNS